MLVYQKNNQVIDMAYYTINNEKSCGIFTDKNLLDKNKTYCPNFEENIFHSKEKATEYLFNRMIQINDSYAEISQIQDYITQERSSMKEEDQPFMTVSLKIDKETKMGVVTDIKQALRQAYALKINYSAQPRQ